MVSIVLLTTEEVLQRNGFWYCLDTIWITQDMEPFEDVKPEHVYSKPLSRDIYYAKFPDIPRSESEDENSVTVKGFLNKHKEWKSKICIRKLDSQRNSMQSTFSLKSDSVCSSNRSTTSEVLKKVKSSITEEIKIEIPKFNIDNDERVRNFFEKLLQSIPPPPEEDLSDLDISIIQPQRIQTEVSDIDLPDYADFENDCILHSNEEQNTGPVSSTLKKSNHKSSSSVNSLRNENPDQFEWYETIYGMSDLMDSKETREFTNSTHRLTTMETDDIISWSEIVEMCGLTESIFEKETLDNEKVISQSHCVNDKISDISDSDEEEAYTKFACNKLRQSLKNKENVPDSSSMDNFNCENEELIKFNIPQNDPSLYKTFYRLAPEEEDLVNV
ncbi:uncharacterized protein LOC123881307 [Maniola jurtina]|uniref:uncharacterized protein LOC123881307 n=1 Tax=Maniola jurtina TaxID=191418 RepID=UPI001E6891CE|nr:uncharacterized protein LOC123881307 [Maniola jurtina]